MIKHRYTNVLCVSVVVVMLAVTLLFAFSESVGVTAQSSEMPYVEKLFSNDRVHTLDIVVDADSWQSLLDTASSKEYIECTVVIDGESRSHVGIRTKGNSSLSTLVNSESDRYSFKLEFDHYVNDQSYYGLDKLALNNIIQDNTYMKDYLCYQMMSFFDAYAPLCSFIWITVNGEDWGLYLAVEGIEDAFLQRSMDSADGQLYKPESMNMGGGNRNMDQNEAPDARKDMQAMQRQVQDDAAQGNAAQGARFFGGGMGSMGSSDVALVYTDDDPESYSNIFDNAKTKPTDADKARLIESLRQLNAGENLEEVVNIDEVLRYFVVHNFVLNFDSYTGSILHNYYLYEEDGQLSMIAWDYNLAFGAFSRGGMGGMGSSAESDATSLVNYPIDTPLSTGTLEDRPMLGQLLGNETYLAQYHELFDAFLETFFESGYFVSMLDSVTEIIAPYVERDPSAFCTYEEYQIGIENLREFCLLRAQSIRGQLDGDIPSTDEGQAADASSLVDASHIDIQAMGSQNGGGFARGGDMNAMQNFAIPENIEELLNVYGFSGLPQFFEEGGMMPPEMAGDGADAAEGIAFSQSLAEGGAQQEAGSENEPDTGNMPGAPPGMAEGGGEDASGPPSFPQAFTESDNMTQVTSDNNALRMPASADAGEGDAESTEDAAQTVSSASALEEAASPDDQAPVQRVNIGGANWPLTQEEEQAQPNLYLYLGIACAILAIGLLVVILYKR